MPGYLFNKFFMLKLTFWIRLYSLDFDAKVLLSFFLAEKFHSLLDKKIELVKEFIK